MPNRLFYADNLDALRNHVAELFQGKRPAIPFPDPLVALRKARREEKAEQKSLL